MIKLGSYVPLSGRDMFLGSVKTALSYDANTFMVYTGAPQNTVRKDISDMNIEAGRCCMAEHGLEEFIVHAPYIINLANTVNARTFALGVEFLSLELKRSAALGAGVLVLHPGAHVGAGAEAGIRKIAEGLNEVLADRPDCLIALETMAGKGSEIGSSFEELAAIYEKVKYNDRLRICMDTCHLHDAGYPVAEAFDQVLEAFDRILGISRLAALHINDSKNPAGSRKDRHANIGEGLLGYPALHGIVHHPALEQVPKILETPYRPHPDNPKKTLPPYKEEIAWLLQP